MSLYICQPCKGEFLDEDAARILEDRNVSIACPYCGSEELHVTSPTIEVRLTPAQARLVAGAVAVVKINYARDLKRGGLTDLGRQSYTNDLCELEAASRAIAEAL